MLQNMDTSTSNLIGMESLASNTQPLVNVLTYMIL